MVFQKHKALAIVTVAAVAVVLGMTAVFAMPFADLCSKNTVKNLYFMDENVGQKSKEEIEDIVKEKAKNSESVTINVNGTLLEADVTKAGVSIDVENTVDEIMKAGKDSVFETIKIRNKKVKSMRPKFITDEKLLENTVTEQLSQKGLTFESYVVDVKNNVADFKIKTDVKPIDYKTLISDICENWNTKNEITAKFTDFVWPSAEELQKDFDIEAKDASVVNENGKRKVSGHVVGRKIDFDTLKEKIASKESDFSVAYTTVNPKVYTDDLGEDMFPNLLGKYQTVFSNNGDGRTTNIKLATNKINGYVMNPGDVFSFNGVVGPRTYSAGFKDANVFGASGVEQGVGGGICQVSSTLYLATLYSDLQIVSRRNHNYVVAYAPAGLDATVSYGTIDFKFKNNMQNPIKIKAEVSGNNMIVKIYGTKEADKTITLDTKTLSVTPKGEKRVFDSSLPVGKEVVTQSGYDGRRVQAYKYVKNSNGEVIKTENLGISNYIVLNKTIKYNDGNAQITQGENKEEPVISLPETTVPAIGNNAEREEKPKEAENGNNEEIFEENIEQTQDTPNENNVFENEQRNE